jgi:precorrin-6A/cobalt-precorrin-6A reductase
MPIRILLLGGTAEAAELAARLAGEFGAELDLVTSWAGRTAAGPDLPGRTRIGGFGGVAGLAAYLKDERVAAILDATHPFATRISAQARAAAAQTGLPLLTLDRPPWPKEAGDRWTEVDSLAQAAAALPALGKRAFLTVGAGGVGAFADVQGVWFLVRLLAKPDRPLALGPHALVIGRGPFAFEDERAVMSRHRIDVLVSKASGGAATRAKIEAARALGIPVLLVRRPDLDSQRLAIDPLIAALKRICREIRG